MMLDLYKVDKAEYDVLMAMARGARQRGWWHQYGGSIPEWFQFYVGLENGASLLRGYQPELIPGLLQTEAYARALMQAEPAPATETEIERLVSLRMERQQRLFDEAPLKVWVVINEAALRRTVGGKEVLTEQLEYLKRASVSRTVEIQILPFDAGAHASPHGAFQILGFPLQNDAEVVYVELRTGSLYLEKPSEIETYNLMFTHLQAKAAAPDTTEKRISAIVGQLS